MSRPCTPSAAVASAAERLPASETVSRDVLADCGNSRSPHDAAISDAQEPQLVEASTKWNKATEGFFHEQLAAPVSPAPAGFNNSVVGLRRLGPVVCVLTPPGRSALAVMGVFGPAAVDVVASFFRPSGPRSLIVRIDGSVAFGRWSQGRGEELVIVRRSETDLEIHCHGGTAAVSAILRDLTDAGCRQLPPEQWLRASVAPDGSFRSEQSIIAAEARLALTAARGPRAVEILSHQLAGSLARTWDALAAADAPELQARIGRLLSWDWLGLRLTRPWRVVVSGPPNVGKSSLVNALAGFSRSLVSPVAGTTRDLLETRLVLGGWDVVLVDTAGLRSDAGDAVERAGISRAIDAAREADLIVAVTAAEDSGTPADHRFYDHAAPHIAVVSKADLLPTGHRIAGSPAGIPVSSVTGQGIQELAETIIRAVVPRVPSPGEAVPFTLRQIQHLQDLRYSRGR